MKPNIVFVLTDDQSYYALGRETRSVKTPNLDALSQNGAYFRNCFCASPICSPARASILSGTMPSRHGVHDWIISGNVNVDDLPDFARVRPPIANNESKAVDYLNGLTTYTDVLGDNGYDIALAGKWHLGDTMKKRKGYTYWNTLLRGGCSYYSYDTYFNGKVTANTRYVTDKIADDAIDFLDNYRSDKPFYLGVHFTAPHTPWEQSEHPKEIWDLYEGETFDDVSCAPIHKNQTKHKYIGDTKEKRIDLIRGYFTAVTAMDRALGRIVAKLNEAHLSQNTIIIFTSDNGMNVGQHGVWGKGNGTYPQNFFEESIKVPLIVSGRSIPKGLTVNDLVSHIDLFPTILQLCGEKGSLAQCCGSSFANVFEGKKFEREYVSVFSEYGAVRMIRNEKFKLVRNYVNGDDLFYNLQQDGKEEKNCISSEEYKRQIEEMTTILDRSFADFACQRNDGRYQYPKGMGQIGLATSDGNAAYKQDLEMYYNNEISN